MKLTDAGVVFSATDLSNFLACRRKTALDHAEKRGEITRPRQDDSFLDILRDRGAEHEKQFVERERAATHDVVDLTPRDANDNPHPGLETPELQVAATLAAMRRGAARIVQAALASKDGRWFGYADVLRRIDTPSPNLGAWSYEAIDTKLATETKGASILQLSVYSDAIAEIQGRAPEHLYVVTPVEEERYRVSDYAAYFRLMRKSLLDNAATLGPGIEPPYPEPVAHCDICVWQPVCDERRRADDHLSFVANCSRLQRDELSAIGITTLEALGREKLPADFKPSRGSTATYTRLQDQARLQLDARISKTPKFDTLPIEQDLGLCLLPEPSPGDIFLDLEGAAWACDGGREYLFGVVSINGTDESVYDHFKAMDDAQEKTAFEAVIDRLIAALDAHPDMHVYHYAPYEPTALKKLMGRHATRGPELDRLLRAERFVDLYGVIRHAIRAGIESYSIKELEQFYGFTRTVTLKEAGRCRGIVEGALDRRSLDLIKDVDFDVVREYNKDDCVSTRHLRDWLEKLREDAIARGADVQRPALKQGEPSEEVGQRDQEVLALRARLLDGVPIDPLKQSPAEHARYQLAYLLDWHRREEKAAWWNYFHLRGLPESDLLDEANAVAGLEFVAEVGQEAKSFIHRFSYSPQELEFRRGQTLKTQDGKKFAEVVAHDRVARTLDLLVGPSRRAVRPTALFEHSHVGSKVAEQSLIDLGKMVADAGSADRLGARPERALLLRERPALRDGVFEPPSRDGNASATDYAVEIVTHLNSTTLAIQGPPGSGKTYTGARMILAAIDAGLKVGVTATSHKVIRNLLDAVVKQDRDANARGRRKVPRPVRVGQKPGQNEDDGLAASDDVMLLHENDEALAALADGTVNILGGTAWLWARPEFAGTVDVLFVDEAGQMALANVLAIARAASNTVLLGDPRQLDQPSKGTHPTGVGGSALQYVLGDAQTMPEGAGLFLPITWRLAPRICEFTSDAFYAGALKSKEGLERQVLAGNGEFDGAGLWTVLLAHRGNRNASDEEAAEVVRIVTRLVSKGSTWIDQKGIPHQMTAADIRIVTPFNAHVARIRDRFAMDGPGMEIPPVGTVDKFQGQEAPVVIYSMASSTPADAPRGMEFLYSLNRLNVATSRAQCVVIVVASPALFEPDCATPRQMELANGMCLYGEMAVRNR